MSQDPACKGTNTAEALLASGGHLANVFVYVKDGLGSRTFDVPKQPVTLDQSGCKYHPHMLGVMIGQEVKIVNSDPTTHNIHPQDRKSTRLNSSHGYISYAVFCLKKKTGTEAQPRPAAALHAAEPERLAAVRLPRRIEPHPDLVVMPFATIQRYRRHATGRSCAAA